MSRQLPLAELAGHCAAILLLATAPLAVGALLGWMLFVVLP